MIVWSRVVENLNASFGTQFTNLEEALQYLYKEGLSVRQLTEAAQGECSNVSLREKMKRLGIKMRGKGGPHNIKPFVVTKEEYLTTSYKELAHKYKVDKSTIRRRCQRYIKEIGKKKKTV